MTRQSGHAPDAAPSQARHRPFPAVVLIATSSPCNLKCPSCPCTWLPDIRRNPGLDDRLSPYFSLENYRRVADQCLAHRDGGLVPRIRLSGYGEPLLNKRLGEMVSYSCGIGVPTSLISNGTLLMGEVADVLAGAGLESIELSVDAHQPDLYARLRPGGDFHQLVDNVRRFVRLRAEIPSERRPMLIASVIKGPENAAMIADIEAFWLDMGVDRVSVRKFLTWGVPELAAQQEALGDAPYMAGDAPCPYPFERILVDPAGWVRLCPYDDQKKIPPFGHVARDAIADIWKGAAFEAVRSCHGETFDHAGAAAKAPLCAECEDRCNRSWGHNYLSIVQPR